jgi:hypothetical protein
MSSDQPFESVLVHDTRREKIVKTLILIVVGTHLPLMVASGWRAWFQVKSLELHVSGAVLSPGATISTEVVSYARTPVDVRIELVQGDRAQTLALQTVPGNWNAAYDPRTKRASQQVVVTPEALAVMASGPARVRATATGRHQWMRLPPPLVQEADVEVVPPADVLHVPITLDR